MSKNWNRDFSRLLTVLSHIRALREAEDVIHTDYSDFIDRVLADARRKLKRIRLVKSWEFFPKEDEHDWYVATYPGEHWRVLRAHDDPNSYLQITVDFSSAQHPLEEDKNPYVGLWAPREWPRKVDFCEQLRLLLPRDLQHWISARKDDPPLRTDVQLEDFAAGGRFDTVAFIDRIVKEMLKLAEHRREIDRALRAVRTRRR